MDVVTLELGQLSDLDRGGDVLHHVSTTKIFQQAPIVFSDKVEGHGLLIMIISAVV